MRCYEYELRVPQTKTRLPLVSKQNSGGIMFRKRFNERNTNRHTESVITPCVTTYPNDRLWADYPVPVH